MKNKLQKIFLGSNIKFLRQRKKISQESLAESLGMTRAKLVAIEAGRTKSPHPEDYLNFSAYFQMSIDTLLKVDLKEISPWKLRELESGNDIYLKGRKIRVLAISTNVEEEENVEYVPIKAKMGYRSGYNDPEYIASLPKYSLPHLQKNKTYRIFPTVGESMLPIQPGTDLITAYVEDWSELKDTPCVLILKSQGTDFVFKFATYREEDHDFFLRSLNEREYPPYTVPVEEVLEVWKYHKHLTNDFPSEQPDLQQMVKEIRDMKQKLEQLTN